MSKLIVNSVDDFLALRGEWLGKSNWLEISQGIINNFADATFDYQWIHVDAERAKSESPFGSTIAHGYLILSLIPYMLDEIILVNNLKRLVNYGIEKMFYKSIVPTGSRLRLCATLAKAKDLGGICQVTIQCKFEREGQEYPVLEGSIIYLYYFNE